MRYGVDLGEAIGRRGRDQALAMGLHGRLPVQFACAAPYALRLPRESLRRPVWQVPARSRRQSMRRGQDNRTLIRNRRRDGKPIARG